MAGVVRVGISGWKYPRWRGAFYPKGMPQRAELAHVAARLDTVEINGSFYSLQRPESYRSWREQTPPGFVMAVKGGRFITHMKKLSGVETPLANFFASGVLGLTDRLGPVLWQLPPSLGFDARRLGDFFALLPRSTSDAALLARRHVRRVDGRDLVETDADRPIRHAVEVRHDSYATPEFVALLREHDIGLVVADTAGRWPLITEMTADFVYIRLHGDVELYASGYSADALDTWASRVRDWAVEGQDVFVYFDNDAKLHAPFDAMSLSERLVDLRPVRR